MEQIKKDFLEIKNAMDVFIADESNFEKLEQAGRLMCNVIGKGGKIIACGNGGSLCDASHFAQEMTGKYREDRSPLPAVAISDPSFITCVANDFGFDHIYSRYVEIIGNEGDILLVISTSGNSENVVNAAKKALEMGIHVVGLTGNNGGKLAELCDLELRAPATGYPDRAQEIHLKIVHILINYIERNLYK